MAETTPIADIFLAGQNSEPTADPSMELLAWCGSAVGPINDTWVTSGIPASIPSGANPKSDPIGDLLKTILRRSHNQESTPISPRAEQIVASVALERSLGPIQRALGTASQLEKSGSRSKALDYLYETVDLYLQAQDFAAVDQELGALEISEASNAAVLGLLTVTFAERSLLPSRARLFARARALLSARNDVDFADRALSGLK